MSLRLPSGRTGVFITDPQLRSTVRAIADADKNASNQEFKTYTISPWGAVAADTGTTTRLRLAGQPYDQGSRLYFMRARYYDPDLGRFLSEDPIGISGGLNLYAYAGNDPVNASDPSGMLTCVPHAYRVPVTTKSSEGRVLRADTAWNQAVGVGLDCSDDGDPGGSLVPGTEGPAKGGGPGGPGPQTVDRGPRPSCRLELAQLVANFALDASSVVGVGLGAKLAVRGGAELLLGEAMETGLALNGGVNGMRVGRTSLIAGQWLGRYSSRGAEAAIANGQAELLRSSMALGVAASAQAGPASSPVMLDDGGHFDWKLLIPGVGTLRAWNSYQSCRNGD